MATIREKTIIQQKANADCPTHARTDVWIRKHVIRIDEPIARGGTDVAATPTETLVAALLGCTNVILHKVSKLHGVHILALSLGAEVSFDRRGVTLQEEVSVPFPEIRLAINLTTMASEEELLPVKSDLARFCPVSKTLRQSGTRINEVWTVRRP